MIVPIRRSLLAGIAGAIAGLTAFAFTAPVLAQAYPTRPITLIVPWGAGGGTDATARIIGTLLEKELGPAGQRRQPHRRQRRRRPRGDRVGARPTATRSASSRSRSA